MSLMIPSILWGLLALAVAGLALYRRSIANQEDDQVHVLSGNASTLESQTIIAGKLDAIDKWGKLLTVIAVVFGLVLAALWVWRVWNQAPGTGLIG